MARKRTTVSETVTQETAPGTESGGNGAMAQEGEPGNQAEGDILSPPFGRHLVRTERRELPYLLSGEDIRQKVKELTATFSEMAHLQAEYKQIKDEMKAKMSALLSKQARLANTISTGEELRGTDIEIYIAGDGTVVEEVRADTGKIVQVRPPTDEERSPGLFSKDYSDEFSEDSPEEGEL